MTCRKTAMPRNKAEPEVILTSGSSRPQYGVYGFFGVLYSASFWTGSQTVS